MDNTELIETEEILQKQQEEVLLVSNIIKNVKKVQHKYIDEFLAQERKRIKDKKELSLVHDYEYLRMSMMENLASAKALADVSMDLFQGVQNPALIELSMNSIKLVNEIAKTISQLHKDTSIEKAKIINNESAKIKIERQKIAMEKEELELKKLKTPESEKKMFDKSGNELTFE